jgi:hypothetical protein
LLMHLLTRVALAFAALQMASHAGNADIDAPIADYLDDVKVCGRVGSWATCGPVPHLPTGLTG